ncbi:MULTISPECIES: DedA family protein [unclassified Paenibacillus]|uniref:DedA family protein n=1 Tax=unclassified Paenibacillus TaxID=185978 RepID=UPI001C0F9930|nr:MULTISPECIES: DedA family protein [unclassified Paenibacillus]MBU5443273.1 DedA family protein [Paenibacillus sp. MSJ-34]
MDFLHHIEQLFHDYGYYVLFFGLLLEFIALPFPGETTMAYAGYLSYEGHLLWPALMAVAFIGTTIGMTITYYVGYKLGMPFIRRYGKWVLLSPAKMEKTEKWFEKYGNSLIFIGYFIPGIRHFTGYFSGIIRLPFRKFAMYAYSGALFWVIIFISIGKLFGPHWAVAFQVFEKYAMKTIVAACILLAVYLIFRFRKPIMKLWNKRIGNRKQN